METQTSIRDYLSGKNQGHRSIFENLDAVLSNILNDRSEVHYKYASAQQSLEAFRITTELESSGELTPDNIGKYNDELVIAMRMFLFDKGKASGLLKTFVYTKRATIKDLGTSLQTAVSGLNIISAIVLVRATIEQVAAASVANSEINKLFDYQGLTTDEKTERINSLIEIVSKRGKGTRIDWEAYLLKSLREGKKKSYVAEEGTFDLTATDLMNNIDFLNKIIKGTRKAYEFASEFAHPNVGAHNLYIQSASYRTLSDDIRIWERVSARDFPKKGIDLLEERIVEMLEIAIESISYFLIIAGELEAKQNTIRNWTKEIIKNGINNHPFIFTLKEPCPCFSGLEFGKCCGKKVKALHKQLFIS